MFMLLLERIVTDILNNLAEPGLYLLIFAYLIAFYEACKMVLNYGG